ncbi:MAG: nucleoside phosphorylase [Desulfobacterales bacterium]|nr:nucleoside phosphorylase [Desulfobacterales bacterium]
MNIDSGIIFPKKGKGSPELGPLAVVAGTETDFSLLRVLLEFAADDYRKLFTSHLHFSDRPAGGICLCGPLVGAPYAVMVLENLIAWGAEKIIFLGWCGSISHKVNIGDIVVATSALIDEGTSGHYRHAENGQTFPSERLTNRLVAELNNSQTKFHSGPIWTTDAIYRETQRKVKTYQRRNALAVEMEISALFTVATYRGVDIGAMAVVSDELASFKWRAGFKTQEFKRGRRAACEVIKALCQKM